jgi:hypothetical protein
MAVECILVLIAADVVDGHIDGFSWSKISLRLPSSVWSAAVLSIGLA